ncbi:unnamed protein product [Closterium sp. Yama58-4]|nr:unnamed protein product [Closterium sp. Yama58-4]
MAHPVRCRSGAGRKPKWPFMEKAVYRKFLSHRGKGLPMRVLDSYPPNLIVNADQTPLFLEMPAERTLEMTGAHTVHVHTASYEKERLTVMLVVTAGGLKLPPFVVFKRKTLPQIPVPRDAAEVEVLEDVCEEELDELIPNPFYPDPAAAAEKDGAAAVAEAGEGGWTGEDSEEDADYEVDEEEIEDSSDDEESEKSSDNEESEEEGEAEEVGVGQEWDDDDEWWAEGRYDGEEADVWVAGQDDE